MYNHLTFFPFFPPSSDRVLPDLLDPLEHQVPLVVDSTLASSLSHRRRPPIPTACSVLMTLTFSVTATLRWTAL